MNGEAIKVQSVFTKGALLYPKLDDTANARTAFLAVSNDSASTLKSMGFSDQTANDIATNGFWKIIVQSVSETHMDSFSLANTLSDTISIFSTGATPVGIMLTGMVLTTPDKDDRLNFLKLYADKIRGTQMTFAKEILCLGYKDTLMRLYIQNISLSSNSQNETFTQISIAVVASHYTTVTYSQTLDSLESDTLETKMNIPKGVSILGIEIPELGF